MTFVGVEAGDGRAKLRTTDDTLAPRVISQDDSGAKVALVATTALLLGGDRVDLGLHVGPGAWLEIVETAGTVAYDAHGEPSSWNVDVVIEDGGLLLWHGEPLVVSAGANTLRRSHFALAERASMCIRETVVLGRSGEVGGAVRIRNGITTSDGPLLVEDLDLREPAVRELPGVIGHMRVIDTLTVAGLVPPAVPQMPVGNCFALDSAGAMARALRSGLAESPVGGWWAHWSAAARADHLRRPRSPGERRTPVPAR